jgi:hypothetical protein
VRNREEWLRALLGTTGVVNMAVGAWAEIAPHGWYRTFPGAGHHWVSAVGPYDEHLVRDVGASLLALGLLMLWTALAPRASVLRPALVSVLVFSVLHFGYHAAAWEHMGVGDNIANLAVLSLVVLVPAALLWVDLRKPDKNDLALEYEEALTVALSTVPDDLLARLRRQYDDAQLAQLTGDIALAGYRSRREPAPTIS